MRTCKSISQSASTNAYVNDVPTEHKHKQKKKAYACLCRGCLGLRLCLRRNLIIITNYFFGCVLLVRSVCWHKTSCYQNVSIICFCQNEYEALKHWCINSLRRQFKMTILVTDNYKFLKICWLIKAMSHGWRFYFSSVWLTSFSGSLIFPRLTRSRGSFLEAPGNYRAR